MSGFTPSELDAKSHGRKNLLSQAQEPPWAFLPFGYRASAVASAMSGQFPPPSASPSVPYSTHHLPPAAPTPSQYPTAPPHRLRVPTLGSSPPPAQGHLPPWGHTAQNASLNSLSGNLSYFAAPHIGSISGPGRGQPQPWQAGPKPTALPVGGNPLFGLQMLVTQEASSAGGGVTSIRPTDDYQQETMDLSSHSGSTNVFDDHQAVRKDNIRNGGIVSNGEIDNSAEGRKSPAKPLESVSVIAHNPLREAQESILGTVLNCSSKPDPKPAEKVLESSQELKPPQIPSTEKSVLPISIASLDTKSTAAQSPLPQTETPVVPSMGSSVEKMIVPPEDITTSDKQNLPPTNVVITDKSVTPLLSNMAENPMIPASGSIVENPLTSSSTKVVDIWEGSNHTPDNVESILENMFQSQEDKSNSSKALPLVVPQSVIVTNDARSSLQVDVSKLITTVEKPASPEKINEQKLAEILKVEEPDVDLEIDDDKVLEKDKKTDISAVKVNEIQDTSDNLSAAITKKEDISFVDLSMDTSSEDLKPTLDSEKSSQSSEFSEATISQVIDSKQSLNVAPDIPISSSAPVVATEVIESAKKFTEVESQLEEMFAGIVEPGSELSCVKTESSTAGQSNISADRKKLSVQERKRGRPKGGQPARRNSDSVFSLDNSSKKKQKRPSDSDKKTKKSKLDSGRDSPVVKKGRGSYVKDASNDSGSTVGVKSRGPLIRIEGSRENPTSVIVVNSGVRTSDEDENTEKVTKAQFRKHSSYHQEGRASKIVGSGLYNSTLSSRYDSHTPDATWICVFCKRGPHCGGGLGGEPAGDLFGPYVISSLSSDTDNEKSRGSCPSDREISEEQKRRGCGKQASIRATGGAEQFMQKINRKRKRSVSIDSETGLSGMVPVLGEKNEYEVWMHEQCAVWAPGMYLIGSKLVGLQEAVWEAVKTVCSKCGEPGASISCVTRGCSLLLHYGCAVLDEWQLDMETFIAKCRNHIKGAGFFPSGALIKPT